MKKHLFTTLLCTALLLGVGCGKTDEPKSPKSINEEASLFPLTDTEVVEAYMKHTLGMIPGAEIDYDEAKSYLTDDLKAQFQNPMFVPTSYCIQDGPTNVKIVSSELGASSINIVVSGQYGDDWQNMWEFSLVPDTQNKDNHWLIKEIECLND